MDAIQITTTVGQNGQIFVPNLIAGELVEVIILRKSKSQAIVRKGGWAKGQIKILPGFDDPIPGMDEYQ
jgi:hypothetical protein